jgi:adenylate kinase
MAGRRGTLLTDRTSVVSMVGVPGSGKSSVDPRLAERFGATYIGTGELLRVRATTDDALGRMIAALLTGGDIVPDDVIFEVLMAALDAPRPGRLVLDGVPRTDGQMRVIGAGDLAIQLDMVVLLDVPDHIAVARLTSRAERSPRPDDKLNRSPRSRPPGRDAEGGGAQRRLGDPSNYRCLWGPTRRDWPCCGRDRAQPTPVGIGHMIRPLTCPFGLAGRDSKRGRTERRAHTARSGPLLDRRRRRMESGHCAGCRYWSDGSRAH